MSSSARKITYHLFDLNTLRLELEKQNTVILKEQVSWNGDKQVSDNLREMDPIEALAAAKSRAHGKAPKDRITCKSNFVVGYGEGRATRELDLIWWQIYTILMLLAKCALDCMLAECNCDKFSPHKTFSKSVLTLDNS